MTEGGRAIIPISHLGSKNLHDLSSHIEKSITEGSEDIFLTVAMLPTCAN